MTWAIVGVSAQGLTGSGGGNVTMTEPAGAASGHLMVATLAFIGTTTFTAPAGWTLIGESINATASFHWYYIIRGGSAPSLIWTRTGGSNVTGRITAYSASAAITFINDTAGTPTSPSGLSHGCAGVTTTGTSDLVLGFAVTNSGSVAANDFDATDPGTNSGTTPDTSTAPTSGTWKLRYSDLRAVSSPHSFAFADAVRTSAGATGNLVVTSASNTVASCGIAAFTESGGGGGGPTAAVSNYYRRRKNQMIYLKQSTANQKVLLGPFVDATDGVTAETALTIANTDIKIFKAGTTTLANKNSGGATHISGGSYYAVLDATDTDTLGSGSLIVQVAGARDERHDFTVWPANAYDSMIGGTDVLNADVTQWTGANVATPDTAGYPKVTVKSGTGTGEISLSAGRVLQQAGIRKNQALAKFTFLMTDSTNHNPATGLTVSGAARIDGGASGALTDTVTELANGLYEVDLSAAELNGNVIALRFTATGADDLNITVITEP